MSSGPEERPVPEPGLSDEAQQPEAADVSAEVVTVGMEGDGVTRADDELDPVELEP